jgi:hypothetical protein
MPDDSRFAVFANGGAAGHSKGSRLVRFSA